MIVTCLWEICTASLIIDSRCTSLSKSLTENFFPMDAKSRTILSWFLTKAWRNGLEDNCTKSDVRAYIEKKIVVHSGRCHCREVIGLPGNVFTSVWRSTKVDHCTTTVRNADEKFRKIVRREKLIADWKASLRKKSRILREGQETEKITPAFFCFFRCPPDAQKIRWIPCCANSEPLTVRRMEVRTTTKMLSHLTANRRDDDMNRSRNSPSSVVWTLPRRKRLAEARRGLNICPQERKGRMASAKIKSHGLKMKWNSIGSFSTVSTPIFASKYSLGRPWRDISDLHPSEPLQSQNFSRLWAKVRQNVWHYHYRNANIFV
jgi:hypothetical protein